jgi:hypothetical protein
MAAKELGKKAIYLDMPVLNNSSLPYLQPAQPLIIFLKLVESYLKISSVI